MRTMITAAIGRPHGHCRQPTSRSSLPSNSLSPGVGQSDDLFLAGPDKSSGMYHPLACLLQLARHIYDTPLDCLMGQHVAMPPQTHRHTPTRPYRGSCRPNPPQSESWRPQPQLSPHAGHNRHQPACHDCHRAAESPPMSRPTYTHRSRTYILIQIHMLHIGKI
jgi:hypothetical protein